MHRKLISISTKLSTVEHLILPVGYESFDTGAFYDRSTKQ